MTFSTPIPQKKNNININHKNAGRKVCIFLYPYRKESVFPLLSGKGLGLPAFCRKAALMGLAGQEKIILAALRYFSRKPCLSGSICRWALVVQRAAKARVFTLKNKEYATSDHHKTVTSSDRDARDKKTESTRPATGNQAATKGNHRSRSHLKAAEPRSGNLQTSGQEQAAGRILQRILKHIV